MLKGSPRRHCSSRHPRSEFLSAERSAAMAVDTNDMLVGVSQVRVHSHTTSSPSYPCQACFRFRTALRCAIVDGRHTVRINARLHNRFSWQSCLKLSKIHAVLFSVHRQTHICADPHQEAKTWQVSSRAQCCKCNITCNQRTRSPHTIHVVRKPFMDRLVGVKCTLVVATSPMTAGHHQLPLDFARLDVGSLFKVAQCLYESRVVIINVGGSTKRHSFHNQKPYLLINFRLHVVSTEPCEYVQVGGKIPKGLGITVSSL